jgi:membrane protein DedA with SNARE-associated domain
VDDTFGFLARNGTAALIAIVFANQLGLPIPADPFLLVAGAYCAKGRLNLPVALGGSVLASFAADALWYELGRRRGVWVLRFLCRVSLEPDSCVRRTQSMFEKRGPWVLIFGKFLPGLGTVAPPLAGLLRMPPLRFLLLDGAGCAIWVGIFLGLGWLFADEIDWVTAYLSNLGAPLTAVAVAVVLLYAGSKYLARRRFLRKLRGARIGPEELKRRMEAAEALFVVDLRQEVDFATDPRLLPGARRIAAEEIEARHAEIPRDRDVILYCT